MFLFLKCSLLGCASGNNPGLGAMETAYIPHKDTLFTNVYSWCATTKLMRMI